MQNPKIKLFYILTVKTIKDIYIMNEKSVVDYFCVGVALHCCHQCCLFFLNKNVKNMFPEGNFTLFIPTTQSVRLGSCPTMILSIFRRI